MKALSVAGLRGISPLLCDLQIAGKDSQTLRLQLGVALGEKRAALADELWALLGSALLSADGIPCQLTEAADQAAAELVSVADSSHCLSECLSGVGDESPISRVRVFFFMAFILSAPLGVLESVTIKWMGSTSGPARLGYSGYSPPMDRRMRQVIPCLHDTTRYLPYFHSLYAVDSKPSCKFAFTDTGVPEV